MHFVFMVMVIVFYSTNGHSTNKDMAVSTFEEILLFEMLHVIMHAAARNPGAAIISHARNNPSEHC